MAQDPLTVNLHAVDEVGPAIAQVSMEFYSVRLQAILDDAQQKLPVKEYTILLDRVTDLVMERDPRDSDEEREADFDARYKDVEEGDF